MGWLIRSRMPASTLVTRRHTLMDGAPKVRRPKVHLGGPLWIQWQLDVFQLPHPRHRVQRRQRWREWYQPLGPQYTVPTLHHRRHTLQRRQRQLLLHIIVRTRWWHRCRHYPHYGTNPNHRHRPQHHRRLPARTSLAASPRRLRQCPRPTGAIVYTIVRIIWPTPPPRYLHRHSTVTSLVTAQLEPRWRPPHPTPRPTFRTGHKKSIDSAINSKNINNIRPRIEKLIKAILVLTFHIWH